MKAQHTKQNGADADQDKKHSLDTVIAEEIAELNDKEKCFLLYLLRDFTKKNPDDRLNSYFPAEEHEAIESFISDVDVFLSEEGGL